MERQISLDDVTGQPENPGTAWAASWPPIALVAQRLLDLLPKRGPGGHPPLPSVLLRYAALVYLGALDALQWVRGNCRLRRQGGILNAKHIVDALPGIPPGLRRPLDSVLTAQEPYRTAAEVVSEAMKPETLSQRKLDDYLAKKRVVLRKDLEEPGGSETARAVYQIGAHAALDKLVARTVEAYRRSRT